MIGGTPDGRIDLIAVRRGTAAEWIDRNPTLAAGESGFETDTRKTKHGDGATPWVSLAYDAGGTGGGSFRGVLADEAARLAITSPVIGDKAIQADPQGQVFELFALPATDALNWFAYPMGVSSASDYIEAGYVETGYVV